MKKLLCLVLALCMMVLCGVSFVAPFWIKLYDLIIDGPARLPYLTKWLMGPKYEEQK